MGGTCCGRIWVLLWWVEPCSIQFSPAAQSCPTLCNPMSRSTTGLPVHHQLPELTQTHVHQVSCHPAISSSVVPFSSCLQSFPASGSFLMSQLVTSSGKVLEFIFSISPSNEHPGLISFRMDCLNLLAIQGTLNSLLQHHSSKASILCCSTFFILQLSHPYMITGKAIALTRQTLVGKVVSAF